MNYPVYAVALLQAVSDDAAQLLHDALAMGDTTGYIIAAIAALMLIVPIVLKALGKKVPVLDPILGFLLKVLRGFTRAPEPAKQEEPTKAESAATKGLDGVVDVKEEK